jgi:hypothetical protein
MPVENALLDRICAAYIKAIEYEAHAPAAYRATPWWEQVRRTSLGPVIGALRTRDFESLRAAYANFFRDGCSTGLIGVPYGMARPYSEPRGDAARLYLIDVLYRLDLWREQTSGRFTWRDLAGPEIGNPFGIVLDGTLVESGAEYRHYCAWRVQQILGATGAVVAEIGGGFGGMAYYLLRDRPAIKYFDFDVPESIALASYYLMTAFPNRRFVLYGEGAPGAEAIAAADIIMMPAFELASLPARSADVTFSSHAISDLPQENKAEYMRQVERISRRWFLNIGPGYPDDHFLNLAESRTSGWNRHKSPDADEIERLYRIGTG